MLAADVFWRLALCLFLLLGAGCRSAALAGTVPAGHETAVGSVVVLPDEGRDTLLRHIGSARSSIEMFAYLFTDRPVGEALAAAVRRGVNVRLILERKPFGGENTQAFARLRSLGVHVRESSPTFRYSHAKVVVIDERIALIGTNNYTRSSFERNREFIAVVDDSALVHSLHALFEADWNKKRTPQLHPALIVSPENSRRKLTSLIDQASVSLRIYESDTSDRRLMDAVARAARRGVDVQFLTSRSPSDTQDDRLLEALREAGVRIGYLTSPYVHAKVLLVDDRYLALGSINATPTSLDQNREIGVLLGNLEAIEVVRSTFERDWQASQETPA